MINEFLFELKTRQIHSYYAQIFFVKFRVCRIVFKFAFQSVFVGLKSMFCIILFVNESRW